MAVVLALCVFAALLGAASAAKCPCEHDYYCSLIGYNQDKEVLGFVRSQVNRTALLYMLYMVHRKSITKYKGGCTSLSN